MNRILVRLVIYFVASFIVFAVFIGTIFAILSSRYNINVHKSEMERRAVNIAGTFSGFFDDGFDFGAFSGRALPGMNRGAASLRAFLYFIEDIAMSDVWLIDHNLDQITFGRTAWGLVTYRDLPAGAEQVILDAIDGKTSVSENFSAFLDVPTITVATPIVLHNGDVRGVVLLHSEVANVNEVTGSGFMILLFSMIAAVFVAVFIAVALSTHFTKPLSKMKKAALQISGGDYSAKTGVRQLDEIGELAAILDDMADRLGQSSLESAKLEKLRRDFVANISHELRTPLTVIRGSLESICDGVVTDAAKVASYHARMLSESKYLERLVSDLLDLAKLQNLDFDIDMQLIDLKETVDDVIHTMGHIAERKGVTIIPVCEGEGFPVMGDYGRIRQMLIIILDNAIKFTPEGKAVGVHLGKSAGNVKLVISDEGCGINPDDRPFIFERFYKQRSEDNKTGTGLGLAIAKQIAERHGVSVHVTANQSGGAMFSFGFAAGSSAKVH